MSPKVLLTVTIDTECDKGPRWEIPKPMSFDSVTNTIPDVLQPLFESFRIKPTYLISPEVLHDEASVSTLQRLDHCELGTHLHPEFIDPGREQFSNRARTPQLAYGPVVELEKLRNLTSLFERSFGYNPSSFRAGRFGISKYTLEFLEELGYLVDSSVCPYMIHPFQNGHKVNFFGAPIQPYFPSTENYNRRGDRDILEVPVTQGNLFLNRLPYLVSRLFAGKKNVLRKVFKKFGEDIRITRLRPFKVELEQMTKFMTELISRQRENYLTINVMFHNNELLPGANPYVKTEDDLDKYLTDLEALFYWLKDNYEVESLGLSEVKEYYQK